MASTSCTPRTARRQSTARGFLPTSPLRGRTQQLPPGQVVRVISIHVPLAGDDQCYRFRLHSQSISIHAPLAGDDYRRCCRLPAMRDFYPRHPCGGRPRAWAVPQNPAKFLSTSPLRGTTTVVPSHSYSPPYFYPRPPCGGRPVIPVKAKFDVDISIHVPLAGDDSWTCSFDSRQQIFLSTSPLRGTTHKCAKSTKAHNISIHVPLAGDDARLHAVTLAQQRISIHVPLAGDDLFALVGTPDTWTISIHVPLAGDDRSPLC